MCAEATGDIQIAADVLHSRAVQLDYARDHPVSGPITPGQFEHPTT